MESRAIAYHLGIISMLTNRGLKIARTTVKYYSAENITVECIDFWRLLSVLPSKFSVN